jgi:hypothetical protein
MNLTGSKIPSLIISTQSSTDKNSHPINNQHVRNLVDADDMETITNNNERKMRKYPNSSINQKLYAYDVLFISKHLSSNGIGLMSITIHLYR